MVGQPGRSAEFYGGARKKTARVGRGKTGDSLQLGRRDTRRGRSRQWGARARHHALDGPAASGWAGASSAPLMFEELDAKSRRRAGFPSCSSLFSKRGTCSGGRVPQGRAYEARCQATSLGETRSVSARPCRFTSPRRGFWRETREKFRRGSVRVTPVARAPKSVPDGAAMPRFPLNSVSQLVWYLVRSA